MNAAIEKIVSFGISLGIALAVAGQLPRATLWMMKHAALAQHQMISLGALNRSLISGGRVHSHKKARLDKSEDESSLSVEN